MADELSWVPPGVDAQKANVARVYDYWLGGTHNFQVDRDTARSLVAIDPNIREGARANRAFIGRAVRMLSASGIRQFLDIGSGIPTAQNVHEVAQQVAPGSRVVYADIDPVVVAHSRAILEGNEDAAIIQADLNTPEQILKHPDTIQMLDFSQPIGLLLVAVLHVIPDDDNPLRSVAILRDSLPPGSYVVICHATSDSRPERAAAVETVYNRSVAARSAMRSRAQIERFFQGFDLIEPGLVYIPEWRPDSPQDVPDNPSMFWGLVGVGRKQSLRARDDSYRGTLNQAEDPDQVLLKPLAQADQWAA